MAETPLTLAQRSALEHLLEEVEAALADHAIPRAEAALAEAVEMAPGEAEVLFSRARLVELRDGPGPARPVYEAVITTCPEHADAHYALAELCDAAGDRSSCIRHLLQVHDLDVRADRRAGIGTRADQARIEAIAAETLDRLPPDLAARLRDVPVVLEPRPHRDLVAEGFDPRALGLFEGADHRGLRSEELAWAPTRIVLFYANLLADFPDDGVLAEQIEVTVLHEIGHFFGLDEDQVADLGLA